MCTGHNDNSSSHITRIYRGCSEAIPILYVVYFYSTCNYRGWQKQVPVQPHCISTELLRTRLFHTETRASVTNKRRSWPRLLAGVQGVDLKENPVLKMRNWASVRRLWVQLMQLLMPTPATWNNARLLMEVQPWKQSSLFVPPRQRQPWRRAMTPTCFKWTLNRTTTIHTWRQVQKDTVVTKAVRRMTKTH